MRGAGAEDHRMVDSPQSVSGNVKELVGWKDTGFNDESYEASQAVGKEEMRRNFGPDERDKAAPERLIKILEFLAVRMDDGGETQAILERARGIERTSSVIPLNREKPEEILKRLLDGGYDETIKTGHIARKGEFYVVALYLLANAFGNSQADMTDALARLAKYDDPNVSVYEHGIEGLGAEPYLVNLCRRIIEKDHLHQAVRERTQAILAANETLPRGIANENLDAMTPHAA